MACIFFTPFFTVVYIVERLVLQTIYVLKKEILQFFGLPTVYLELQQEDFVKILSLLIKPELYLSAENFHNKAKST